MRSTVVGFPGNEAFAGLLSRAMEAQSSTSQLHRFPDGESRVSVDPHHEYDTVIIVATLHDPDPVVLPLLFLARTLRDHGARRVILAAPYLAYMRQDTQFNPGEGVSARYFAALLSEYFDGLVTVDPHLHRISSLDQVYRIPARVVHAAPAIADWIRNNVEAPVLIGPDSESAQWVEDVGQRAGAPHTVLEKIRHGDRAVEIALPAMDSWRELTPVLVDDVISSGGTMIEAVRQLRAAGFVDPICIGVHGIFAGESDTRIHTAGAAKIVTSNTIAHASNAMDVSGLVAAAVRKLTEA